MAFVQRPTISSMTKNDSPAPSPSSPSPTEPQSQSPSQSWTSNRSLKQASLFFAGATFMTASVLLTRRTIRKRHLSIFPKRFTPSNQPPAMPISGPLDAFEAMNLATLNVTAFAIMMVGGMGWALDISNIAELRQKVRGGMGVDGTGRSEQEVEEEFEEWLATVLERKSEKEKARRLVGEPLEKKWMNERGKER